jgi:hypothetical protein
VKVLPHICGCFFISFYFLFFSSTQVPGTANPWLSGSYAFEAFLNCSERVPGGAGSTTLLGCAVIGAGDYYACRPCDINT